MKFRLLYKYLIIFLIPLSIIQPVKADLASDLLKKAQELSEKQKIKGKKLEAFILSNIITVDYEGKEQTYKFNKDITYNVYENSKVIGDGTWAIKGLTKSSIKLSGYRDIYFQIYSSKDKISTLTNLKKKNDNQTNRKILKISSFDDFEKELANSKTKKEKKEVVKKEEVKKDKKISNSSANNNYIYYSDIKDDKYFKKIGFFKRGKGALKINLTNYSYIVKSANKDYEVEYVAAIESERKDAGFTVYSGNFTATNLKSGKSKNYKFSIREDSSSFEFLESSLLLELKFPRATWYRYSGMTCKNEQNPQCMKRLSEVSIIGFRDLKNNFSYKDFVNDYIKNVEEPKRIAEEKKKAEEKKFKEEQKKIEEKLLALRVEVKQESSKSRLPLCEDDSSSNTRSTLQKQSKRWLNCFGGLLFNLSDGGTLKYIGEFGPNIGLSGHDQVAIPGAPGYFHGYGTYTFINSNDQLEKYVGQFYKGAMNGQGTMYFKDGSRYEGMVSNKEFNGAGKLFSPDGSIEKEGIWENGKLVQSKKIEIVEDKQLKDCSAVEEILKKNISEKVKTLGGYRHIHFGMSRDDVLKIGDCSNSNINKIQGAFDSNNFGIDSFNSGIILSGLYKYSLGIMFKKNDTGPGSTVDKIELKVLTKIRQKEYYNFGSSGIKEFEKLKDLLSDKYKLITKPSDISIDKYNSNPVRGTLSWVFKSNYNDNLIILELQGTRGMDGINYIYTGEVHYLSENQSKIYIEKIDSKKIKSDDL